jgi:hypothetical protein
VPAPQFRTDRYNWELTRGLITALGTSQTLRAWAADERCTVSRETLRTRLALGWEPEKAITTPRHQKPPMNFTYAGRTLSLRGWSEQSGIRYHTLYNRLRKSGMTFSEALEKGGDGPHFALNVSAFGETKPLSHWAVDPRANCAYETMRRRLLQGWDPDQAITEEPHQRSTLGAGIPYRAFGLSMGLEDWARHTQIPAGHLRRRIDHYGMPLEAVLTSLGWTPRPEERIEPDLLRITTAQLQPGDHILGVEPGTGQQVLTVRRTHASPVAQEKTPGLPPRPLRRSVRTVPTPQQQPTAQGRPAPPVRR